LLERALIVAGVMSGTSADGINVAVAGITGAGFATRFELIGHYESPFSKPVRQAILAVMNAPSVSVADLSRLNFLLGELYADAVLRAQKQLRVRQIELVGCHGQTIYHQGDPAAFLGKEIAATWQIGEGAVIAARVGVPVVSDFRPADMAAGGKGAPLVPFVDYALFRDEHVGRIAQNLGGIANITAIPAGAHPGDVIALDTGPGNMVIDAVCERLFRQPFDRDGQIAARGKVDQRIVKVILEGKFFRRKPPRTAGREEFGREFVGAFLKRCGRMRKEDVLATATALTASSIGQALRNFVVRGQGGSYRDYIVSGGGSRNRTLMRMLAAEVEPLGLRVRTSDEFGVPSSAKEALAFAVLAFETWHRRPSNLPSATGAGRPAILGKISYA
jgi:anhydro-N-acetylmuramic acid kinase